MRYPGWQDSAIELLGSLGALDLPAAGQDAPVLRHGRIVGLFQGQRYELDLSSLSRIDVPFDPPLDLGLSVVPQAVDTVLAWASGDAKFDGLYTTSADEMDRARRLLTPPVLAAMVTVLGPSARVRLTDDGVHSSGEGLDWLRLVLPAVSEIGREISERRATVPTPAALAGHREALRRLGVEFGLRADDTPVRLSGEIDRVRVRAELRRESAGGFALHASLGLEDALNVDLRITPAGLLTPLCALLPGQTDHRVGDPAFDAAFHVRTSAPATVAPALDEGLRRTLLSISGMARTLGLDDRGLTVVVRCRPESPAEPAEVVRAGVGFVGALARAIRTGPAGERRGPFR